MSTQAHAGVRQGMREHFMRQVTPRSGVGLRHASGCGISIDATLRRKTFMYDETAPAFPHGFDDVNRRSIAMNLPWILLFAVVMVFDLYALAGHFR